LTGMSLLDIFLTKIGQTLISKIENLLEDILKLKIPPKKKYQKKKSFWLILDYDTTLIKV